MDGRKEGRKDANKQHRAPISLLSTLMRTRQSCYFPRSHGDCLKQFGSNWMKRNKWVDIAVYGWLSQTHRHWLEAHSPFYAHSKKMTYICSILAPNRRRSCSGLHCQLCHLLIFSWRKNKTEQIFYFNLNKVSADPKQIYLAFFLSFYLTCKEMKERKTENA